MRDLYDSKQLFTADQCDEIKNWCIDHGKWYEAEVYGKNSTGAVNPKTRKGTVKFFHCTHRNIFPYSDILLLHVEKFAQEWNIRINTDSLDYQFAKYVKGDFFKSHRDVHLNYQTANSELIRKITFSLQLSDPSEYEGGKLEIENRDNEYIQADKTKGMIYMFPSWLHHSVSEVKSGIRYALVGWQKGPFFG